MTNARIVLVALCCAALHVTALRAEVTGEVQTFAGPDGIQERCIRLTPLPGAVYSKKDQETEAAYCAIDFARTGLCPKLWSTSPGTLVYALEDDSSTGVEAFERSWCGKGHGARDHALDKLATFKISVNGRTTSATYAPSSWVYYHLSRYFQTRTYVPPVVFRSMSLARHHERVVLPALTLVKNRHARMLSEGWTHLGALESGQLAGSAAREALTDQGRQVYGVLIDNKGDRYGPEFNGTRESGWGSGQNEDFQQTAAFLALRNTGDLKAAAAEGIREARLNPLMARALPADTPVEQVFLWMQSVLEITLLDYLLRQQDRIGNIDYRWRWYWIEGGVLKSHSAHGDQRPEQAGDRTAWRLRQSAINDNDAGVRSGYANFAERTGMLEELAHYDPALYQRLGRLAADLGAQGESWQWLRTVAGLSEREATGIASRARAAFDLLSAQCRAGTLVLDFDLVALMAGESPAPATCEAP
jgi:hypothetical protein